MTDQAMCRLKEIAEMQSVWQAEEIKMRVQRDFRGKSD